MRLRAGDLSNFSHNAIERVHILVLLPIHNRDLLGELPRRRTRHRVVSRLQKTSYRLRSGRVQATIDGIASLARSSYSINSSRRY